MDLTKDKGRTRGEEGKAGPRLWYSFFLKLIIWFPFLSLSPHAALSGSILPYQDGERTFFSGPLYHAALVASSQRATRTMQ